MTWRNWEWRFNRPLLRRLRVFRRGHSVLIARAITAGAMIFPHELFLGWPVLTAAAAGTSDSSVLRVKSLDQQSAAIFHSPPGWRWQTQRYFPRSSRRFPTALGTSALKRPASYASSPTM